MNLFINTENTERYRQYLELRDALRIEHRGIDRLDRIADRTQHIVFLLDLRHHVGGIDTCKRLVM